MSESAERDDEAIEKIRSFVRAQFPHAKQHLRSDDDSLLDSGVVDSLGVLEIVTFLTAEFGIEVTDEDLNPDTFGSISSLAAFVTERQATT